MLENCEGGGERKKHFDEQVQEEKNGENKHCETN